MKSVETARYKPSAAKNQHPGAALMLDENRPSLPNRPSALSCGRHQGLTDRVDIRALRAVPWGMKRFDERQLPLPEGNALAGHHLPHSILWHAKPSPDIERRFGADQHSVRLQGGQRRIHRVVVVRVCWDNRSKLRDFKALQSALDSCQIRLNLRQTKPKPRRSREKPISHPHRLAVIKDECCD